MTTHTRPLDGLKIAILATDDFEQVELTEPRKALDQAGAKTLIVSTKPGQISGFHHDKKGDMFNVDITLDQTTASDFDGVLLPGGALSADTIRMIPEAREFVRYMDQHNRPMAVICHAPWLLVSSGIAKGRTLTSYYTIQDDVRNAGGNWVDQEVVRDRNLITSRSPKDLSAFNPAIVSLFAEYKSRKAHDVLSS
jgi:protease I